MRNQKKYVWLISFIFLCLVSLRAQNNTRDVVYLKNGSIIKGLVLEVIPNDTIKIQISDGSIFVYSMSEVEKIQKETITSSRSKVPHSVYTSVPVQENTESRVWALSIMGGVAFPTGDFADVNNGAVKTGYIVGMQFAFGMPIGLLVNASYTSNPSHVVDVLASQYNGNGSSGKWQSILIIAGVKVGTANSTGVNLFFAPIFGFNVSSSPEIDYRITQTAYNAGFVMKMESATTVAFTYGATVEADIGHFVIGTRYIACKPKYNISVDYTYTGSVSSISMSLEQSMSILQLYLGFAF